ncbi:glycine oxidase ThiO [Solihabitans fulvus]|uniref:glycine oxidase n=2 Tax=Solihabitans fulvus TaxID=1892852 RepID=A0A5B2XHH2_9PSEU|nr:glycine oxidase ThiO [Solihabitans fulvus]
MSFAGVSGRLTVVGGGVIGLSVAWRAAVAGYAVEVLDPDPGGGASWVAGGMLAPLTEAWPGEEPVLALGLAAQVGWPSYADRLRADSGMSPGLRAEGTLAVALDRADAEVLDALAGHLAGAGRQVTRLTGREVRALEPSLGPSVRSGLSVPQDVSVDNRALLAALRVACEWHGVGFDIRPVARVSAGRVEFTDQSIVDCDVVVITAGAWSGELHPALRGVIRPVKGEILRLRARPGALPPPTRTVRALVRGRPAYLVPRDDGLVLGATEYEAGFDQDVTVGGVRDLLADAELVLPGVAEYALAECAAGFRAGSPDNLPLVGWLEPGVLAATGHHRNGLLLAPITADAVLDLLAGRPVCEEIAAADPERFAQRATTTRTGGAG